MNDVEHTRETILAIVKRTHGAQQRIARRAGVTPTTVSLVLAGRATSANVWAAAEVEVEAILQNAIKEKSEDTGKTN